MIAKGSYLVVSDNSGAKKVQCIHILRNSKRRYARIGDTILVTAKKVKHTKKIVKKKIYRGLLISTAKAFRRRKGQSHRLHQTVTYPATGVSWNTLAQSFMNCSRPRSVKG